MIFNLNFAERPFRNYTLFYTLFGLCAFFVLTLTMYNLFTYIQNKREFGKYADIIRNDQQREQAAQKESAELAGRLKQENTKELLKQVNFINEKIQLRTFSWSDFFNELETQLPPGVKLGSIKPRGKEGEIQIQLSITGKTLKDVLDFIDNLNNSPAFDEVFPRRESRNQMSGNFIDYQIYLKYFPEKVSREMPDAAVLAEKLGEERKDSGPSEGAQFILETGRLSVTGLPFFPMEGMEMLTAPAEEPDMPPADEEEIIALPSGGEGGEPEVSEMEEEGAEIESEHTGTEDAENLFSGSKPENRAEER